MAERFTVHWFTTSIEKLIRQEALVVKGERIVVGFSGGADSVALLYILDQYSQMDESIHLFPIYVHHGLRESCDKDIRVCEKHCAYLGLTLKIQYVDVRKYCQENKVCDEEGARTLRYKAFHQYLKDVEGNKIAVAHHKDDQAETILSRFMRGAGRLGLKGMTFQSYSPYRDQIIRPLLCVAKADIYQFIEEKKLDYAVDETNEQMIYQRNHIRHKFIPYIQENYNPNIVDTLCRTGAVFADEEVYMDQVAEQLFQNLAWEEKGQWVLDGKRLIQEHPALVRRVIRKALEALTGTTKNLEYNHIERVYSLIHQQSGKKIELHKGVRVKKEYDRLRFMKDMACKAPGFFQKLDKNGDKGYIQEAGIKYMLTKENALEYKDSLKKTKNMYTKWFDYDKIKAHLVLRTRQAGDSIHIDCSGHSKKIKKYFIDEKVPQSMRDTIPLLAVEQDVLWIPGYRVNPIYEATRASTTVICVQIIKEDNNGYDN